MQKNLPPLDHLRAFEAAARHLSFKLAAAELNVTPAAVGQRIRSLESQLGTDLFTRRIRQVKLTEDGALLLRDVSKGMTLLRGALSRLQARKRPNILRISATNSFTELLLLPQLPAFASKVPDCDVRIISTDEKLDPNLDEVDVCIRLGPGNYPDLNVLQIGQHPYLPVCAPQLLEGSPAATSLSALNSLPFVEEIWSIEHAAAPSWHTWFETRGAKFLPTQPVVKVSLASHAIRAALDGQGVVLARANYVEKWMARGELVDVLGHSGQEASMFQDYLVWRKNETAKHVLQFIDWSRDAFDPTRSEGPET